MIYFVITNDLTEKEMTTEIDLSNLKWTKNVNHPDPNIDWAYSHNEIRYPFLVPEFNLHWRKEQEENAKKPKKGDLILVRQKTKVTHLVKVIDNHPEHTPNGDYSIYRRVQLLWMAQEPWAATPHQNDIFGFDADFPRNGKAIDLDNIDDLTEHFIALGGKTAFQEHIAQKLGLGK